jgi:hypothetical protein
MAATIEEIQAAAGGTAPLERGTFTQSLIDIASAAMPPDSVLLALLRTALLQQARFTGPSVRLPPASRDQLYRRMSAGSAQNGSGRASVMMLAIECAGQPLEQALLGFIEDVLRNEASQASGVDLVKQVLTNLGIKLKWSDALLQGVVRMMVATPGSNIGAHLSALKFLGFQSIEPVERRYPIFQRVVLPLLEHFTRVDAADAALIIEQVIYNEHIKALERPDHHRDSFAAIAGSLRSLGAAHGRRLPALQAPTRAGRPRVAFFLHNGHRLAHVEVLLSFLAGLSQCADQPIEAFVYLLNEAGYDDMAAQCGKYGVEVHALRSSPASPMTVRFEQCRQQLSVLGAAAIVYVSVPMHLEYLTALKLAPVSIWWSMKFPLPNFPLLDGRVFFRRLFAGKVDIEGQTWYGGPLGLELPAEPDAAAVAVIRAKYPGGPILGTVAREEKIREPVYLAAVAEIMKAHPTASFLWTGRRPLPEIVQYFDAQGIGGRCHFIGWVDPAVYCRVFDVFLETFPLTGLMSGWAMALGQAVATAGPLGWLGTYLTGIYDGSLPCSAAERAQVDEVFAPVAGRVPCIWSRDGDDFVALVAALLRDDQLRRDFGLCCQHFMRRFLADPAASALTQARFFKEVMTERGGKDSDDQSLRSH